VVGLGNPGSEFGHTRHNLGADVVSLLAERHGGRLRLTRGSRSLTAEVRVDGRRLALAFPQTYVNESGAAVAGLVRRYGVQDLGRLVVVHDELDLELGDVRAKQGGGLAGHNGLRSLAEATGTQDFLRVRIGIGRPERGDRRPVADWVLQPFPPGTDVDRLVRDGADCALSVLRDGVDVAMRTWNGS
jgi:PTH1 family peptidyl-tRNA hydrolase